MIFGSVTKALDGAKCLLFASMTNKPPGRFGGEEDEDQEGGLDKSASGGQDLKEGLTGKIHCKARGILHDHSLFC